ncbi:MAG: hypothetical protein AAFX85_16290 [Pseudomonadota bacterium]
MASHEKKVKEDKDLAGARGRPAGQRPVRIDEELMLRVEEAARRSHRSVPKQLEYWARLGSAVEPELTMKEVDDLFDAATEARRVERKRAAE